MKKGLIVMQSDFGIDTGLAACMHGICKLVDEDLEIHDITHVLPPFDIKAASFCLQYSVPCWPAGTVFVSVVDPGVGTARKASVARLKNGSYVVTPDNGTLTYLNRMIGIEAIREIDEKINRYDKTRDVHTFHGRDLFSYCAARLAAGVITFEETGPEYPVGDIVMHPVLEGEVTAGRATGYVQSFDAFGSAEISILNKEFSKSGFQHGDLLNVEITLDGQPVFAEEVLYERSFGYVEIGENVLFNDLSSFITIACNQSDFRKTYGLRGDTAYKVEITAVKVSKIGGV